MCARISCTHILRTSDRPLAHTVRSLYAALQYDVSCINMHSKDSVFRRQYQTPKKLEPLLLQTWRAHILHPTYHCCPPNWPGSSGHTSLALLATRALILNAHRLHVKTQDSPIYRRVCLCSEWAQGITSTQMHVHLHTGRSFNQAVIPSLKFLLLRTVIVAKRAAMSQVETATCGYLHDG